MLLLPGFLCLGFGGCSGLTEFRHFCVRRTRNRSGGRALRIQERLNVPALRRLERNFLSVKLITCYRVPERRGEGCTALIVTSAPDMLLSESEAAMVRKSFTTLQALS